MLVVLGTSNVESGVEWQSGLAVITVGDSTSRATIASSCCFVYTLSAAMLCSVQEAIVPGITFGVLVSVGGKFPMRTQLFSH